jgi:hypothetical protein
MSLTTPQDVITFALKAIGVIGVGQTALAEDNSDAFSALNAMLGQWSRRRWLIWHLLDESVPTTGQKTYTVGPGGDFNVPRPDRLEAAYFVQLVNSEPNQVSFPLTLLESMEDYAQIALKGLVSWPQAIFYDPAIPLGVVYPIPIPQADNYQLHILIKDTLAAFTSYSQAINLPPEYFEALWTNLAIRLCAIYPGAVAGDEVKGLAKAALTTIRQENAAVPRLRMPPILVRPPLYNIFSGQTY